MMQGVWIPWQQVINKFTLADNIYAQDKAGIIFLLPVLQVLQEVDKRGLIEDTLLRERVEIVRVC